MLKLLALAGAVALASGASHSAPELPHIKSSDGEFVTYAGKFEIKRSKTYQVETNDLEDANDELAAQLAGLDIAAVEAQAAKINADVTAASEADVAGVSKSIKETAKSVADASAAWSTQHAKDQTALMAAVDTLNAEDFQKSLATELDNLRKELMTDITNGKNDAMKKAAASDSQAETVKAGGESLADELSKYEVCSGSGKMYSPGADSADANGCIFSKSPTAGFKTRVYHRMMNNADGRDSGYVNNRYIQFKKAQDHTYIRVFYYDNFRVHGHTAHANWNVMICDANGNGCAHCRDPGRINHNKYSNHQHNWWMNDHLAHGVMGMCKASDNRQLKKGTYQLKVMINNNRYDIYTGHNQGNSFMVDEVIKA
jgi:hypothetical protein